MENSYFIVVHSTFINTKNRLRSIFNNKKYLTLKIIQFLGHFRPNVAFLKSRCLVLAT